MATHQRSKNLSPTEHTYGLIALHQESEAEKVSFEIYSQDKSPYSVSTNMRSILLAKRLREARKACGLTQQQVARRLDWPQSTVSKIERAEKEVRATELFDLAMIYSRSLDYFIC